MDNTLFWIGFLLFIGVFLALDLGVFHREAHVVPPREAAGWTLVWVTLAVLFGIGVLAWEGTETGIAWFTGYVIEYSLSVDNVFVFALIFGAFAVPRELQHRVLFWGVVGALVMRFVMILAGAHLIETYHWIIYVFGAFLVFTGIRMAMSGGGHAAHPEQNIVVRVARRHLRVVPEYHGQSFLIRTAVGLAATPLLLALITVETSDLIFAVDSIPAIFAVTTDPFVVFTSNAFAILGLRSLYFLLADAADRFRYLKLGLAAVLVFVGAKMLLTDLLKVPPVLSLVAILAILAAAIAASLFADRRDGARPTEPAAP
ncbi:MAG: TerC family protein [Thermoleophilia bacterium]|nr:TerC family protein [Thermoleophilia bacterium]